MIVITRDVEDGGLFAQALGPSADVVFMPVTTIMPASPQELEHLVAAAAVPYHHAFVASRHAVSPLVAALAASSNSPGTSPPVTAVGAATAAALTAAGFRAFARGDTGEAAAHALVALGLRGLRVLAPRAAGGRDEPLDILRTAGADVIDAVAYRTIAAAQGAPEVEAGKRALLEGAAACLVFAPSQVSALDAVLAHDGGLGVLAQTRVIAIGPTTAAALVARGVRLAAVADAPTPEGMAKALASVYPHSQS
ncbi:MAG TPA: uroporphyrinogen-III synthase [Kofleriaceae bacterium]|nr:uroporphyrinogen-III synthase [Kofleriaceae bacterium]